jgi:hypothetical protein
VPEYLARDIFRKNACWKILLIQVRKRFVGLYGANVGFGEKQRGEQLRAIETSIMAATLSQRLVVCDAYVGQGPAATKASDEVHLLMSGRTPFGLRPIAEAHLPSDLAPTGRPVENWTKPKTTAYKVIGDCYVHGLMHGSVESDSSQEWTMIPLM